MEKHWCMCTELESVYRDGFSTCSICGGIDAYGKSKYRPQDKQKQVTMRPLFPTRKDESNTEPNQGATP